MMLVIGVILGGLAGAAFGNSVGAVVAGAFIGGVVGFLIRSNREPAPQAGSPLDARMAALEARVTGLEKAMHRLVDAPAFAPASSTPATRVAPPTVEAEAAAPVDGAAGESPTATTADAPPPMPHYGEREEMPAGMQVPDAPVLAASTPVEPPRPPAPPAPPNALWQWITGGNVLARIGAVVLLIGVAFLARYAVEHVTVPIELRLAGIAVLGLVLLGFGWRLRHARRGYALTLQGAGIGVLYVTVFAAFALYHLLPPALAFFLLVALVAEAGVLAVRQDALALAVLGTLGGFAAPVLVSSGSGNHVALFTFYAILDVGVFAIAWVKPWRALNLLGFLCTFVIATAWGVLRYRPENFTTTEPFLVLFFLLYVGIAVAYALQRSLEVRAPIDGMLVFGTPLVCAGLQAALVRPYEYGMSISAVVMAAVYIGLAYLMHSRRREGLRLLTDAFAALGLVFATLAVPLAVDARWTSATWALEGAALVWVGLRQGRFALRLFGLFLQVAASLAFVRDVDLRWVVMAGEETPVLNSRFVGALLIAVAGVFSAWRYHGQRAACRTGEAVVVPIALGWGLLWWLGAGFAEVDRFAPAGHAVALAVAWLAFTGALVLVVARGLSFELARVPTVALVPALFATALVQGAIVSARGGHLFAALDAAPWLAAIAVGVVALRVLERTAMPARVLAAAHVTLMWLVFVLAAEEAAWLVRLASSVETWRLASWLLVPAVMSTALCKWHAPTRWPFDRWRAAQLSVGAGVVVLVLVTVALLANFVADGNAAPLPYVPLLNPLDLTFAAIALAAVIWWQELRRLGAARAFDVGALAGIGALAGVLWITMSTVRVVHHFADVPFRFDAAWHSSIVQAALALVWTLTALAAMVLGNRRGSRAAWMGGATLGGVVIVKLFLVDFAQAGDIARIVSFIGVGILFLVIGYLAPVPARRVEDAA
jgi:uncharacterized membrane protein